MEFIERIYWSVQGLMEEPVDGIENAFEDGSVCDSCYEQMLEAYDRLRQRLQVKMRIRMWKPLSRHSRLL